MDLILSTRPRGSRRLCVLGAGNCNDLDLARLREEFTELHLVDIDAQAMLLAVKRQRMEDDGSIVRHGGIDLSGIAERLDAYRRSAASALETEELVRQAGRTPDVGLRDRFDVVVSSALLTQLMNPAVALLGSEHARLPALLDAIRTAHLRLMIDTMATGGEGVLVSDVTSSETCPEVAQVTQQDLPGLAQRLSREKEFYLGVDPSVIESQLCHDPYIAPRVSRLGRIRPWRWRISQRRTFLVYGFTFWKL